jgi:hypothetical protein
MTLATRRTWPYLVTAAVVAGIVAAYLVASLLPNAPAMTPAQCRAALALIDMSEDKLSQGAGVPIATVRDFEQAGTVTRQADIDGLQAALEKAGVEFIEGGVRLRKGTRPAK